jgi:hypothetical protein
MKKIPAVLLTLMSCLPTFAAPRDDSESGIGLWGLLLIPIFIIIGIISEKNENKNK